mgnify:FL=1
METIVLVLMLAVTVEALVEYGKLLGQAALSRDYQGLSVMAAALVVAVLLCFATGADFYAALGVHFAYSWVGVLLTGVFASRGANFVSDLLSRLNSIKK